MKKLCLLLMIGCGHGATSGDPVPAGTFCFTVADQPEACVSAQTVTAHKTVASGNTWFQIQTLVSMPWHDDFGHPEMDPFPVTLSGQVPQEARFPRLADLAQLSVPVGGTCRHYRATSPFGGCGEESIAAICQALEKQITMQVVALSDTDVELQIEGTLDVHLPDPCCDNSTATCNPAPPAPAFTPDGPYPITARIHATF